MRAIDAARQTGRRDIWNAVSEITGCPYCAAPIGSPCRTSSGDRAEQAHYERCHKEISSVEHAGEVFAGHVVARIREASIGG